jgi:iron(III) transport system substrate-binding protein
MHSIGGTLIIAAVSLLFTACAKAPDAEFDDERKEPVVVYAAFEDDADLRDLYRRYTDESGVLVIIRRGSPRDIVTDLIENKVNPPADVLVTQSVTDIWRAAEEGALRAYYSETLREKAHAWLRDPDDLWFGTAYRTAVVVHNMPGLDAADLADFSTLANPRFSGSLCLSSSAIPVNRIVIAMMIDKMGTREAENVVRSWLANLALPPFDDEDQLLKAIRTGLCRIGIASSSAVAMALPDSANFELSVLTPATTYADVDGVGVARHARNPDGAAALVEWMFSIDVQEYYARQNLSYPANMSATHAKELDTSGRDKVSQKNVSLVAWHETEAIRLIERAQYRR